MACAYDPTDPADMSPDERLDEVAALLAQGVLRLRQRSASSAALDQDTGRIDVVNADEAEISRAFQSTFTGKIKQMRCKHVAARDESGSTFFLRNVIKYLTEQIKCF